MKAEQITDGIFVSGIFLKYESSEGVKDGKKFSKNNITLATPGAGRDDVIRIKVDEAFVPPAKHSVFSAKVKFSLFKEFLTFTLVEEVK
jgi:hypothetical protein